MKREEALQQLRDQSTRFDILIVGGGATGLGAAVDAAKRGHRVALVDQADFSAGTSSCSTKLVHGGVRYLRQGDVSLVRSALRERAQMLRNAPHLARAVPFVIPSYSWWERPFYRIGLGLYDRLSGPWSIGRSRLLSREETIQHLPTIETAGLRGGVLYYDGQFDDARFAIALAETAAEQGAVLANYCRCVGLVKHQGRVVGALVRDEETGQQFEVRAKAVVNATGVFVDALRSYDEPNTKPLVAVSQGIHLVLPRRFLPGNAALMVPKTADGRVLFAIPWQDRVVVGTTDTAGVEPTLTPRAQDHEIDFVLSHARKYLACDPSASDVLSVFTGLRPLVASQGESTASLSRDHTILVSKGNLVTITGGKWTTYRKMAEDVINCAERIAGLAHRHSCTDKLKVHGAPEEAGDPASPLASYGDDAAGIRALATEVPALAAPLHPSLPYLKAEVVWHARREMARTVEDVLARRTRALVLDAAAAVGAAPEVARLLAHELRRDQNWIDLQLAQFNSRAANWRLVVPSAA